MTILLDISLKKTTTLPCNCASNILGHEPLGASQRRLVTMKQLMTLIAQQTLARITSLVQSCDAVDSMTCVLLHSASQEFIYIGKFMHI